MIEKQKIKFYREENIVSIFKLQHRSYILLNVNIVSKNT